MRARVWLIVLLATAAFADEAASWKKTLDDGLAEHRRGNYERAVRLLQQARTAAIEAEASRKSIAQMAGLIGTCHDRLGQHDKAAEELRRAIRHSPVAHDRRLCRAQLASTYVKTGKLDQAELLTCDVLGDLEGDVFAEASCLLVLSSIDARRGRPRSALRMIVQAVERLETIERGDPGFVGTGALGARALVGLDMHELYSAKPAAAVDILLRAVAIFEAATQLEAAQARDMRTAAAACVSALLAMGKQAGAARVLDRYDVGEGRAHGVGEKLLRLSRAELHIAGGDLPAAEAILAGMQSGSSRRVRARKLLMSARLRTAQRRVEAAREAYRKAIRELSAGRAKGLAWSAATREWAAMEASIGEISRAVALAHGACTVLLKIVGGKNSAFKKAHQALIDYKRRAQTPEGEYGLVGVRRGDEVEDGWKATDKLVDQFVRTARRHEQDREYEQGLVALDLALDLRPGDHRALGSKSVLLVRLERVPEALATAREAAEWSPPWAKLQQLLAALYAIQKDWEPVIVHATRTTILDSESDEPFTFLAHARAERGEWRLAEVAAREQTRRQPEVSDIWQILAKALIRQGKLKDASDLLGESGSRLRPSRVSYLEAVISNLRNEPKEALELCEQAIQQVEDGFDDVELLKAIVLFDLADRQRAAELLDDLGQDEVRACCYRLLCGESDALEALREHADRAGNEPYRRLLRFFEGDGPADGASLGEGANAETACRIRFYAGAWLAARSWWDEARPHLAAAAGSELFIAERMSAERMLSRAGRNDSR